MNSNLQTNSAKGMYILLGASVIALMASLYLIFFYVPTEETMGVVQRIFYFHVPVAWTALLSYGILFVASIMYLVKQQKKWDVLAFTAGEIGLFFTTMFLMTGSIWAKPAWGVWWTWSPRLTSALVLWFIYIAYHTIRIYTQGEERRARFAAAVAIIGFCDIPIVILSISIWRTQHPDAIIFEGGLAPSMMLTLMISILAFTLIYALILIQSYRINNAREKVKELVITTELEK